MSKQSIEISTIFRPIYTIKSIKLSHKQNDTYYFILSTVDCQMMFIQITCQPDPHNSNKNNVTQKHSIVQVQSMVTAIYFDKIRKYVYMGCYNGDVIKASISKMKKQQPEVQVNVLELQQTKYIAKQTQQSQIILTVYETNKQLVTISIQGRVNIHQLTNLTITHSFVLAGNITACTSFYNPYSCTNVSCIALSLSHSSISQYKSSNSIPFIFNCLSQAEFSKTIQKTLKIQHLQPHSSQQQIITICDQVQIVDTHDQVIVACGATNTSNSHMIILYNIVHDGDLNICYLQPVLKFNVNNYVLHMSMKCQVLVISMFNSILFVDLVNKSKLQCIQKSDLAVTITFVLAKNENSIKFMVNKGFNFMQPDKYHDSRLKLRVRDRNINKTK